MNHQYYIPIVDAGVAHQTNDTDVVSILAPQHWVTLTTSLVRSVYARQRDVSRRLARSGQGLTSYRDIWIKNPNGGEYVGQVWPGFAVHILSWLSCSS